MNFKAFFKSLLKMVICCVLTVWIASVALAAGPSTAITADQCISCHGDKSLSKKSASGREISLYVDEASLPTSVHAKTSCTQCHSDILELPHASALKRVGCEACHSKQSQDMAISAHGRTNQDIARDLPLCTTCHGKHDVKQAQDPTSLSFSSNIVKVCTECHTEVKLGAKGDTPDATFVKEYANSVHGMALIKAGLTVSAACNKCHGSHAILPPDDPRSDVNRVKIPEVCGRCHVSILETYKDSIHGRAFRAGISEAPVCTDCHGEHTIARAADPNSKISPRNIPKTCSACHEEERLSAKYGLATKRYVTYMKSFHGLANKFGATFIANCASCHGYHDILPESDPRSSIAKANLPKTCGKCHPGAGENFAKGQIHVEATKESSKGMYYVRQFYTWFIGILMGCFLIYTALELSGRRRRKKNVGKGGSSSG